MGARSKKAKNKTRFSFLIFSPVSCGTSSEEREGFPAPEQPRLYESPILAAGTVKLLLNRGGVRMGVGVGTVTGHLAASGGV